MRTRRDQVQAYRFVTRRIVSAMVSGEPESNELPMRRLGTGIIASVLVGALALAGFGVYGLVTGKGGDLSSDAVVVEKGTGATFVYVAGQLHPTPNYASALLYFGATKAEVQQVSAKALRGRERGRAVGITGAPDSLPAAETLIKGVWQVCSTRPSGGRSVTHLVIGRELPGARVLDQRALVVSTGNQSTSPLFLIYGNRALRVPDKAALIAIGMAAVRPLEVGPQVVNAILAGPDLARPKLPGRGQAFAGTVDGQPAKVGDMFRAGQQNYLLTAQGLAPVGAVTAALEGEQGREISSAAASQILVDAAVVEPDGFPRAIPVADESLKERSVVCAKYQPSGSGADAGATTVELHDTPVAELAPPGPQDAQPVQGTNPVAVIDKIDMTGGAGVLAQQALSTGTAALGTTVFLITDTGTKYALAPPDAQTALGYGGLTPVAVPASVLSLIPDGPVLDPNAARQPAGRSFG